MTTTVYTIGYEGKELDQFLDLLERAGVEMLVDVRERAESRRRGFAKTALSEALGQRGIEYTHLRALGCPRDIRNRLRSDADWEAYSIAYLNYLETQSEALDTLRRLVEKKTCALLCHEADAARCHRGYVTDRLANDTRQEIVVRHIV